MGRCRVGLLSCATLPVGTWPKNHQALHHRRMRSHPRAPPGPTRTPEPPKPPVKSLEGSTCNSMGSASTPSSLMWPSCRPTRNQRIDGSFQQTFFGQQAPLHGRLPAVISMRFDWFYALIMHLLFYSIRNLFEELNTMLIVYYCVSHLLHLPLVVD